MALSGSESEHCAEHLANGESNWLELGRCSIEISHINTVNIAVEVNSDFGDGVGSAGEFEDIVLHVADDWVDRAVVGGVEAEADYVECDFIWVALLLHVEGELVEDAEWLEDVEDPSRGEHRQEVIQVLVGSLSQAVLVQHLWRIVIEALSESVQSSSCKGHVVFGVGGIEVQGLLKEGGAAAAAADLELGLGTIHVQSLVHKSRGNNALDKKHGSHSC